MSVFPLFLLFLFFNEFIFNYRKREGEEVPPAFGASNSLTGANTNAVANDAPGINF